MVHMHQLRSRIRAVENEIRKIGLWVPEMDDTQVYLTPLHIWYGWSGFPSGDIFIPRITPTRWIDDKPWSLRDVLRHEYGHILAWHRPQIMRKWPRCSDRVSDYAHTNRDEDFAETFKFFLKHKGKLPRVWRGHTGIRRRWLGLQEEARLE